MRYFSPFFSLFVSILLLLFAAFPCGATGVAGLAGDPFADNVEHTDNVAPASPIPTARESEESLSGDPFAEESTVVETAQAPAQKQNEEKETFWHRFPLQKGWLESRNQLRLSDGRFISARKRLWLEGGSSFAKNDGLLASTTFFLSASLDFDPAAASLSSDYDDIVAELHEAYLSFEGKRADLFLGRKMLRWGTGDGINPLDLINPLDMRDPFASGRGDNRLPVFLGQGIFSLPTPPRLQELTLEMAAVPLAKVNRIGAAGSAWEPLALQGLRKGEAQGNFELAEQEKAERWFEDGKYALRLTATSGGWDFGIIGYSGLRNNPVFRGHQREDGSVVITPEHPHSTAFGVNFAKGLERSTLRGELAVKPDYPLQTESFSLPEYREEDMVEAVIGFDRTFGLNRYLNLQYFTAIIPENEGLTAHRYENGITYEISDLFLQDDLKLGINGIVGFSGQGWTMQPYGEYTIGDNWLLVLSLFLFEGDKDGSYGQFDRRDFVALRLRWSF